MVLSNKKLKQKIRAELAETLPESKEAQVNGKTVQHLHKNLKAHHHQPLESLLDSAASAPTRRLSKREKRRLRTIPASESENLVVTSVENGDSGKIFEGDVPEEAAEREREKKKKKMMKRGEDGGVVVDGEAAKELEEKNSSEIKKKKKKGKKADNVGVEKGAEPVEQNVVGATSSNDSKENVSVSTKIYVGGIPYYSSEEDIRSFFDGCGTITEVDCLKFPETGKFNGIAMISFKTEAGAKRALALDGSDMGGLFLKIQPYKATKEKKDSDFAPSIMDGYNRIYVGNLSWELTEDDLKNLFSDCTVSSIRLGRDKETGEFRGYAHVDFSDSLSLTMALKLDQQVVLGRPVRIRCAVPPKAGKPSPNTAKPNKKSFLNKKEDDESKLVALTEKSEIRTAVPILGDKTDGNASHLVSGKIRRRTCYECGEKGHLSSSCPKKQSENPANS